MKIFDPSVHINLSSQNSQLDEFVFLDIEASGLGFNSYPIEVAYATSSGEAASVLIKPEYDWLESGEWDNNAERNIHKIALHALLQDGRSAKAVAAELNSALKGKLIFCNDLAYDGVWLAKLFKAADIGVEFFLTDIRAFFELVGEEKTRSFKSAYESISVETMHRALPDARRFVSAYKLVSDQ